MEIEEKNFISLSEAAHILGVHKNTLQRWVKEDWERKKNNQAPNKFLCPPYVRIRSRYKFRAEEIYNFLKTQ